MRALVAGLLAGSLLCCSGSDPGPIEVEQGWQMEGVLVERRGDLLVVRSDGGQMVRLTLLEAQPLPSIRELFEGDRVLATWQGDAEGGAALEVLAAPSVPTAPTGDWADTMGSPGGTMRAPAQVGISNFETPIVRVGPPRPNPVTQELVPADKRPSF